MPRSKIPKAPDCKLEVKNGYQMARTDELAGARRGPNQCVGEGLAFASGSEAVGDAASVASANDMHGIDNAIHPEHRLVRVAGLHDIDDDLTWRDVVRMTCCMVICRARVVDTRGMHHDHIVVFDGWRRLLFLGAGELNREWMVGLLGVRWEDMKSDTMDQRMRELHVIQLVQVRMLEARAPPALPPPPPVAGEQRLGGGQRRRLKRKLARL